MKPEVKCTNVYKRHVQSDKYEPLKDIDAIISERNSSFPVIYFIWLSQSGAAMSAPFLKLKQQTNIWPLLASRCQAWGYSESQIPGVIDKFVASGRMSGYVQLNDYTEFEVNNFRAIPV